MTKEELEIKVKELEEQVRILENSNDNYLHEFVEWEDKCADLQDEINRFYETTIVDMEDFKWRLHLDFDDEDYETICKVIDNYIRFYQKKEVD